MLGNDQVTTYDCDGFTRVDDAMSAELLVRVKAWLETRFYEIAAADAWPLWSDVTTIKYCNYARSNEQMIVGVPTNEPRTAALPVRMRGLWKDGNVEGIFAVQGAGKQRHFGSFRERVGAT